MAGLITHVGISIFLFIVVMIWFRKLWYALAISLGQVVPDAVKFGITGIKLKSLSPAVIIRDDLFWKLETLMTSYTFWTILGLIIIFASLGFYYMKMIKKKDVRDINWSYLFFIIGVVIHLAIDIFIIEASSWV